MSKPADASGGQVSNGEEHRRSGKSVKGAKNCYEKDGSDKGARGTGSLTDHTTDSSLGNEEKVVGKSGAQRPHMNAVSGADGAKWQNSMVSSNSAASTGPSTHSLSKSGGGSTDSNKALKVLLLGSGESGKSTILQQLKILHQNGFTNEELLEYKPFIFDNIIELSLIHI